MYFIQIASIPIKRRNRTIFLIILPSPLALNNFVIVECHFHCTLFEIA